MQKRHSRLEIQVNVHPMSFRSSFLQLLGKEAQDPSNERMQLRLPPVPRLLGSAFGCTPLRWIFRASLSLLKSVHIFLRAF